MVEAHSGIASTNARLFELSRRGAPAGTVVIADEQTCGRGRRGRRWHSPPGSSLSLSYLMAGRQLPRDVSTLPLLIGVQTAIAVERAVQALGGALFVGLKWPNDLVTSGGKIGGVLCERALGGGSEDRLVAGVGINLARPARGYPKEIENRASSIEEEADLPAGKEKSLAEAVAGELVPALGVLAALASPILPAESWRELRKRDSLAGLPVTTEAVGAGTARGIHRDGSLLVELPMGELRKVRSGGVRVHGYS